MTLIISYFLSPQIEYIRFDSNPIFAILSNPTGIAADNAGYIYVIDSETESKKDTTNGTFVKEHFLPMD